MFYIRSLLVSVFILIFQGIIFAQGCCSGGGSNPIAGGAATGVLQEYQMEVSLNYQNNISNKFFEGREEVSQEGIYDELSSEYLFLRTDYGISKKLTLSLATGYHFNKTLKEKDTTIILSNSGMGDLIIFPRYDIYNETKGNIRSVITLGVGLKIPIGSHTDTMETRPDIWDLIPPTIQLSTGGTDLLFYSFFFREYKKQKLRFFVNSLYIKKGYNSLDEKFGDYTSVSLFASKTFFRKWGLTTQLKAERIGQIEARQSKLLDLVIRDPFEAENFLDKQKATGSKKWFFIPQLSYSKNGITVFATSEIPLYQYLNGTQVGSQSQFTFGVNYRFLTKKCEDPLPLLN